LLPVAFDSLTNPCLPDLFTDQYPAMPGVIMMAAMFALFVVEMWLNGKMGGHSHSHGGPMGFDSHAAPLPAPPGPSYPAPPQRPPRYTVDGEFETEDIEYEKKLAQKMYDENARNQVPANPFADGNEMGPQSEMPAWFIVFYEQYVRQRLELVKMIKASSPSAHEQPQSAPRTTVPAGPEIDSPYLDPETGRPVDPLVFKKMSLNITLLEGGILFHSVFVGITVSLTIEGFVILLVAILFHQMFEGLGLGSRIAAVPYKRGSLRPWVLVVAFGTTAPIGMAIGLMVRGGYDPNSAFGLIIVGIFNAM
jgi:solute carrier family 39 (zinc transporter), member 1/2/3